MCVKKVVKPTPISNGAVCVKNVSVKQRMDHVMLGRISLKMTVPSSLDGGVKRVPVSLTNRKGQGSNQTRIDHKYETEQMFSNGRE